MNPKRLATLAALAFAPSFFFADLSLADDEGRAIYTSVCSACHAPENVMVSAPKAGDAAEWGRRLSKKGIEATTENAVSGFAAMPPKGGASELSRQQIRLAIEYMAAPLK